MGTGRVMTLAETTHCTNVYFYLNMSDSPALDCLLRDFLTEPGRRSEQYRLDGDKCARLARQLWIYILPQYVSFRLRPLDAITTSDL